MSVINGGNPDHIIQEITEEDRYLLKLVDTIPAKIYFNQDIQEKIKSEKHVAMDLKAENLKRKNHIELSAKNKHKRARLDPLFQKSVSQIHQEMGNKKERKKKMKGLHRPSVSLARATNIEELQKRLQEKITELQVKRKSCLNDGALKKRLKSKEKKLKHKKVALAQVKNVEMPAKKLSKNNQNKPEEKFKYNKEGKIIYSKLDFSEDGLEEKKKSEFSGKNYKQLLKKVELKKEKMEKLKQKDSEKATIVEEKEKWKKAILKSQGVKVKDDPQLLKKALKKKEKIKRKKGKEWKERIEETEAKKKARQEKRTRNIQKRKKDRLEHKMKRAKKKGRVIPGF